MTNLSLGRRVIHKILGANTPDHVTANPTKTVAKKFRRSCSSLTAPPPPHGQQRLRRKIAKDDVAAWSANQKNHGKEHGKNECAYISPLITFESAVLQFPFTYSRSPSGLRPEPNDICESCADDTFSARHANTLSEKSYSTPIGPFDLDIWPNLGCSGGRGGHVVLGRNGSGKTLLARSLVHSSGDPNAAVTLDYTLSRDEYHDNPYLRSGALSNSEESIPETKSKTENFLSHVSFESHSELLLRYHSTTVHRVLIPSGGNRLSSTAKFLSVRLGMFPLLPRQIHTLSTGEIRRVLLVRALVTKPKLLILDNAFDGLDIHGRTALHDIIEKVLKGFQMDILVQGVGEARDTARTQVLLFTHRPEEISERMDTVSFMYKKEGGKVKTERRKNRPGSDLVRSLMCLEDKAMSGSDEGQSQSSLFANFPSDVEIKQFWGDSKPQLPSTRLFNKDASHSGSKNTLVQAHKLEVTRDGVTLLSDINWLVQRGERWHLAGSNGAGKSTLTRLLVQMNMNNTGPNCDTRQPGNADRCSAAEGNQIIISDGFLTVIRPTCSSNKKIAPGTKASSAAKRGGIGWVSTELHLHAAHNWGNLTVLELLLRGTTLSISSLEKNMISTPSVPVNIDFALECARWLGLVNIETKSDDGHHNTEEHPFFVQTFSSLSQGEQKLVLIVSAIAQRPSLLILDEPCQGLDLWNRGRVLGIIERLCQLTDLSLVYVTHHEEELISSITQRLCLENGKVLYCGPR